jgi:hypothetical protein
MLYRHTQLGWLTIIILVVMAVVMVPWMVTLQLNAGAAIVGGVLLVVLALFATLSVTVDPDRLRFHLGIGLIRKTIRLDRVRHYAPVRNRWYWGWGIRFYPGGLLYNVSGLDAVELVLDGGKRLRIGTDEPQALCAVLETVLGPAEPLSPTELKQARCSTRTGVIILSLVLAAVACLLGVAFYLQEQPPRVTITPDTFRVKSFVYAAELPLADITAVNLEDDHPRVLERTNGYALKRTLRGHFRLAHLGEGLLFIEYGRAPYVVVRRGADFIVVNFESPADTRRLYETLESAWRNARKHGG